ncbi:hypothetical protein [Acaryochloris marina]|uniref:Uncharacterized protein n=1 Tax=Acaryochloris marina (strain MBIC 11017) TaxID=329726 RepID=A8ZMD6_ACAM1|nr:hypothetical protein [Acaryochloris marina]ABW32347.1 hypothetical protein AM1_C0037 [Acaryochloris marina MBIC11017]
MTDRNSSDHNLQPNPILSHAQIWGKTGHGKVALAISDEHSPTPSHLKINFHPKPSR